MRFALSTVSTLAVASVALGQEFPDPNPVPQADGTNLWYVGNNTQYPVIQDVLDAASDGDEIVVRAGLYVESLHIDNNEITLRPFVSASYDGGCTGCSSAEWEAVTFLNPTNGFNNDNGYAMKLEGGRGTYIGEPRQFTELSNGLDVETKIVPRDAMDYSAQGSPVDLQEIEKWEGECDGDRCILFMSRSLDDVAIWSDSGRGTFQECDVTSMQGSGGGLMVTGSNNQTMFTDMNLCDLYATGNIHAESGEPVCVINVTGDATNRAMFHDVDVRNCDSAQYGVIYQNGADTEWSDCDFDDNDARAADGLIMATAGRGLFVDCEIEGNMSGRGTFYWDAEGSEATDMFRFIGVEFEDNDTITNLYGGVAWVDHASATGGQPQIAFSDCTFSGNNDLDFPNPTDSEDSYLETEADYAIHTPYFPEYRIGQINGGNGYTSAASTIPADINSDGAIDTTDLDAMYELLGMCRNDLDDSGEIDFNDLLNVLVDFGNTCE